jgi:hypothetical protein
LQRIRREADDESIPLCLTDLKTYQISHMNSVINTLLAFMRSSDPRSIDCVDIVSNTEEEVFSTLLWLGQLHDQYLVELAHPQTDDHASNPGATTRGGNSSP